jgi:hypothetical protein
MERGKRRRVSWRWALRAGAALFGLATLTAAAWVASNWNDAQAAPRPAALALPALRVADERNAFFALTALFAQDDRRPHDVGRERWARSLESAARIAAARGDPALMAAAVPRSNESILPRPSGPPYVCESGSGYCTDEWLAQPAALAAQLDARRARGGGLRVGPTRRSPTRTDRG